MAEFESKTREELIEEIRHLRTQVITTRERNATISYDNMFQFVGLMDPQGNLLQVNPAALKISGGKPVYRSVLISYSTQYSPRNFSSINFNCTY
jgi:PAS domain-containing protein